MDCSLLELPDLPDERRASLAASAAELADRIETDEVFPVGARWTHVELDWIADSVSLACRSGGEHDRPARAREARVSRVAIEPRASVQELGRWLREDFPRQVNAGRIESTMEPSHWITVGNLHEFLDFYPEDMIAGVADDELESTMRDIALDLNQNLWVDPADTIPDLTAELRRCRDEICERNTKAD